MILAIENSSPNGSVALGQMAANASVEVLWRADFQTGRGRGGELFVALEEAWRVARETADAKLEEIIVGLGPGSYAGVRLAVSAAVGLALATGARLGGRSSALALATDAPEYHAIGDARRGTYYYTTVRAGRALAGPELLPTLATLSDRVNHVGRGWPLFLADGSALPMTKLNATVCLPDAARLLSRRLEPMEIVPAGGAPEPIYLRAPTITLPKNAGAKLPSFPSQ